VVPSPCNPSQEWVSSDSNLRTEVIPRLALRRCVGDERVMVIEGRADGSGYPVEQGTAGG
jgi:hypothetical protein